MCEGTATLDGCHMSSYNQPRPGASSITQNALGPRPLGVLGIALGDIMLPEDGGDCFAGTAPVGVGVRRDSKTNRARIAMGFSAQKSYELLYAASLGTCLSLCWRLMAPTNDA